MEQVYRWPSLFVYFFSFLVNVSCFVAVVIAVVTAVHFHVILACCKQVATTSGFLEVDLAWKYDVCFQSSNVLASAVHILKLERLTLWNNG